MPNYINKIKLPNNDVYEIQDANALPKTTQINGTSADLSTGNYALTGDDIKLSSSYVVPQTYTPPVAGVTSVEDSIANLVKHVDDAVAGSVTSVDEDPNSHLDITTATGGAVTVAVADGYVIPPSTVQTPASEGTTVSLVSTGNMYTWNDKQSGITMDISDTENPEQIVTTRIVDGNKNTKLIGGTAVTLTPDTTNGTITINSSDTTYSDFVGSGQDHAAGLVPDPGSTAGDSKFLCEDGSWAEPPGTTYSEGTGIDIDSSNVISNTGVTAVAPSDSSTGTNGTISVTTNGTTAEVAVKGLNNAAYKDVATSISASGAVDTKVATEKAVADSISGKAIGANSSTTNAIATFAGTDGKTLADSAVTIAKDATGVTDDDTKVPTSKAVKTYVDATATGISRYIGTITATSQLSTTAKKGDFYIVSTAWTGVHVGDEIIAEKNGPAQTIDGTNWTLLHNEADTNTTYAFAEGTDNGKFTVTPSDTGTAQSVTVHGLKSAAYTESTAYATSSHVHGNITNAGALQTTDVSIATGDKLVVTDASDSNKVARTSAAFDGSITTKCLTQKGTFETFGTSNLAVGTGATDAAAGNHTHGNVTNAGTITASGVTIASGDALAIVDSSDSSKIAKTSVTFDGSTTGKALTQKGTFESYQTPITASAKLSSDYVDDTNKTHKFATAAQLTQIATNQSNILYGLNRNAKNLIDFKLLQQDKDITGIHHAIYRQEHTQFPFYLHQRSKSVWR